MRRTVWNTAKVEPAWQFDYYRSGLCESFAHLTPHKPTEGDRFSATVEHWVSGGTEFTFLGTSSHRVSRSRGDIAKVGDDDFYLNFIQRGEMHLDQFDVRQLLRRGDFVVIDNAHVFDAQIKADGGHRHLAFRMDRRKFSGGAMELSCRLKSHPLAPALRHTLAYLCHIDQNWDSDHLASAIAAIESLVSVIASGEAPDANSSRAHSTLHNVRRIISARFGDHEFSLDEVADQLRMPRRSLQKHLQLCGYNFSAMLLEARLAQAHLMLIRSGENACIEEICFRCGFNELSTFYRAFKSHFGIPPGALRNRLADPEAGSSERATNPDGSGD
jgi:AraC-like DNA-binding protein